MLDEIKCCKSQKCPLCCVDMQTVLFLWARILKYMSEIFTTKFIIKILQQAVTLDNPPHCEEFSVDLRNSEMC